MKTDIFHLQILPVDSIIAHEIHDERRMRPLVDKIKKTGILVNPIIVADLGKGKYMQLDGMNRLTAIQTLTFPYICAQIVDYHDPSMMELAAWIHFFSGDIHSLTKRLQTFDTLKIEKKPFALEPQRLCTLMTKDAETYAVTVQGGPTEKARILSTFVELYKNGIERDVLPRDATTENIQHLFEGHPKTNMMAIFPSFTMEQIIAAVKDGVRFPSGITRFIIKRRCLNVSVPLELIEGSSSIEESNRKLEEMISARGFRVYEEPTVYFE